MQLGGAMVFSIVAALLFRVAIGYVMRRMDAQRVQVNNENALLPRPSNKPRTQLAPPMFSPGLQGSILAPKHNWCAEAISKISASCCPIFDFVDAQQRQKVEEEYLGTRWSSERGPYFGRVLDAGTGGHSLDWLCNLRDIGGVGELWALTGDVHRERSMRKKFGKRLEEKLASTGDDGGDRSLAEARENAKPGQANPALRDRIFTGNWKNESLLQGEVFDVIIADYLLGSVDAFAPYFQQRLLERLLPHLTEDGRLYFVGLEPYPDRDPDNKHGQLVIDIGKTRDACILLAGERPYREYPMTWVMRSLKEAGYEIVTVGFFEIVQTRAFVERQIEVGEAKLEKFQEEGLCEAMKERLENLRERVRELKWGVSYGDDYVIVAQRAKDKPSSENKPSDIPVAHKAVEDEPSKPNSESADGRPQLRNRRSKTHVSVEDQNFVFPIDDES